jgi:hypothetical protein
MAFQQKVKNCIAGIKGKLGINVKTPLHWRDHCRKHDVRKYVAGEISRLEAITAIYVISDKKMVPDSNSGIQLADLYAGILGAAMIADRFGNYETGYLGTIKHQIRKSANGKINGYGIKLISADNSLQSFKWWPDGWI